MANCLVYYVLDEKRQNERKGKEQGKVKECFRIDNFFPSQIVFALVLVLKMLVNLFLPDLKK